MYQGLDLSDPLVAAVVVQIRQPLLHGDVLGLGPRVPQYPARPRPPDAVDPGEDGLDLGAGLAGPEEPEAVGVLDGHVGPLALQGGHGVGGVADEDGAAAVPAVEGVHVLQVPDLDLSCDAFGKKRNSRVLLSPQKLTE